MAVPGRCKGASAGWWALPVPTPNSSLLHIPSLPCTQVTQNSSQCFQTCQPFNTSVSLHILFSPLDTTSLLPLPHPYDQLLLVFLYLAPALLPPQGGCPDVHLAEPGATRPPAKHICIMLYHHQ